MKLTYPLLLNAKPQDKPYKLRDRDSMYLLVSVAGSKTWKFVRAHGTRGPVHI